MHAEDVLPELRTDFNLLDKSAPIATPSAWRDFHRVSPRGGSGAVVVVRDSGIDADHPVFNGVEIEQPNINGLPTNQRDDVGHGTMVASLIALGVEAAGIDKFVSVPIFGQSGRTDLGTITSSYDYIIDRWGGTEADVYVNDSWGARSKVPQIDRRHNEMEQAGIDSVVAAGNTDQTSGSPATATRAYAVAGCTLDGKMTRFSSPTDDIAAVSLNVAGAKSQHANLGEPVPEDAYDDVMKAVGGLWNYAPGTSFGCPITLGAGVNFQTTQTSLAAEPDETRLFEQAFNKTAHDIKGSEEDGQGYFDYEAATEVGGQPPEKPNPQGRAVTWDFAGGTGIWHNKDWWDGSYDTELVEAGDGRALVEFTKNPDLTVVDSLQDLLTAKSLPVERE